MIESHGTSSAILRYEEEGTREIKRRGRIYVRPLRVVGWFEEELEILNGCDMIIGDLNARHVIWGEEWGDTNINVYGKRLVKWIDRNGYQVAINTDKTFRKQSTIDLKIFKKIHETPRRTTTDKCELEHLGQIVK